MKRYVIKRPAGTRLPDRLARFREELNEEQFAVATAPAGASLVIAGAGSGKTRAITYRVAYLVEHNVAPARPQQRRVQRLAEREPERPRPRLRQADDQLVLQQRAQARAADDERGVLRGGGAPGVEELLLRLRDRGTLA